MQKTQFAAVFIITKPENATEKKGEPVRVMAGCNEGNRPFARTGGFPGAA